MKRRSLFLLMAPVLFSSCISQIPGDPELLAFISDNKTTRTEVILKFGQPSAMIETDHILMYRLGGDKKSGYFIREETSSWADTKYSLILVFDADGVLRSHSQVRVQ